MKKIINFALRGLVITGTCICLASQADAVQITLGGTVYNVRTAEGSFNELEEQLTSTPWWGDFSAETAVNAANQVGESFGLPNGPPPTSVGPVFAFGFIFESDFVGTVYRDGQASNSTVFADPLSSNFTFAVVPEPITALGSILLLLMGVSLKQKYADSEKFGSKGQSFNR